MGKVTTFFEIARRGSVPAFLVLCLVASSAPANACRVDPPQPTEAQLRAPPDDAAVAAKAIIRRVLAGGPPIQIPSSLDHPTHRFRLELQIVEVFKGDPGPLIIVAYGLCHHFLPGEIGEIINVLARRFNDELVAYYY
jgi:hypothetical protein